MTVLLFEKEKNNQQQPQPPGTIIIRMIIVTYHHHHRPRRPRQNSNDEDDSTDHGGDPAGSFIPIATVPWHAFFYASNTIVHSPIDGGWSKVSSNNGLFDFTVVLLRSANGTGVGSVVGNDQDDHDDDDGA
jgi:hypothetical protein